MSFILFFFSFFLSFVFPFSDSLAWLLFNTFHDSCTVHYTYFRCTIWWILEEVHTGEATTTIRTANVPFTPQEMHLSDSWLVPLHPLPPGTIGLSSVSESFCFVDEFTCVLFLDSTHKQYRVVLLLLFLAHFTENGVLFFLFSVTRSSSILYFFFRSQIEICSPLLYVCFYAASFCSVMIYFCFLTFTMFIFFQVTWIFLAIIEAWFFL